MSEDQHLRRLNEQYVAASLAGDVEWYRSHLADDFVCIESDGSVLLLAPRTEGPTTISVKL